MGSLNRVVAHLRGGKLVKGYTGVVPVDDPDALVKRTEVSLPLEIPVRKLESDDVVKLPLETLKALFFVKTFEGRKSEFELKHFESGPSVGGLWVRVKFYDNEWIEGLMRNSMHLLTDPGFFLKPPDSQSNNEILYVVKASLADFMVRGVRYTY